MNHQNGAQTFSDKRWSYGLYVVLGGLLVVAAAFVFAVFKVDKASVSALYAGLTGVTGTIVGAYFGVQVGQSGKHEADQARDKAEERATQLAMTANKDDPDVRTILGFM
jgi:hypothetical protein